ncbi:MAG TPA: hypothetical protein VK474_01250 [Chthoniobacterales bacterium]|nr:hypothetical protein [Chthoniobacterales bacterium]
MNRLLGLYREKQYSPGRHLSNDVLLLDQIAERLRERSCAVELADLAETSDLPADTALVFSMCQGRSSLEHLAEWERAGRLIINSPHSALNTHRDRLPAVMVEAGVAFPQTHLVPTNGDAELASLDLRGGIWLKRGDVHAAVRADVQRVDSREQLGAGLAEFAKRGVTLAAIQAHRAGDEIKFYGVGNGFFHWFYSGAAERYAFAPEALEALARQAASAAGLDIFGGDVIVSAAGDLTLIDLNDWPSFAPCREAASHAIADFIMQRLHVH